MISELKKYLLFNISIVPCLLVCNRCFGQQGADLGSWNILNIKWSITERWSIFGEAQIRSLKFYGDFHYHEYKGGVNFKAHSNVVLTLAAGDYDTYREGGNFINPKNNDEFRLWPQITLLHSIEKFKIEQRYRSEFRFTRNGYRNRFRYRLGVSYPFGNNQSGFQPYQIGVSNELFFTNNEPYFERNRLLVSLGYRVSKQVLLQAGYLHQFDYKINDETGRDFLQIGIYMEIKKKRPPKS
jgi:long-subunit fatty acid transport protein